MKVEEIQNLDELRELCGWPSEPVKTKATTFLHPLHQAFINASPFCMLGTADAAGTCDVSPKGDPGGSFLIIDKHTLVIPDRPGNKRMDGWVNVLSNPHVGSIFILPGRPDTLRVNGRARLLKDAEFFDQLVVKGHRPKLALLVEVQEAYFHCSKAFMRSKFWDPESWNPTAVPRRAVLSQAIENPDCTVEELDERYGPSYAQTLYKEA